VRDMFQVFDGNLYEIDYDDHNNGMSALMEHGSFWQYIPHIHISYH
jgi:hypothetical protein